MYVASYAAAHAQTSHAVKSTWENQHGWSGLCVHCRMNGHICAIFELMLAQCKEMEPSSIKFTIMSWPGDMQLPRRLTVCLAGAC